MRGSIAHQVQQVFKSINHIGHSKHEAKAEARANGARTWEQIGRQIFVYSHSTADKYRDVWKAALSYVKEFHGVKDIERLQPDHIRSYLDHKASENVGASTYAQHAAALGKLEVALNQYAAQNGTGREYQFASAIRESREAVAGTLHRHDMSRAYYDPSRLIDAIAHDKYRLAASIQYESGARISEANNIMKSQLQGFRADPITGEQRGIIEVRGKGGKVRELSLNISTYSKVAEHVKSDGKWHFNENHYRESLKEAATATAQDYQGSHGLRWNFAQERHYQIQDMAGKTYEQSLVQVSHEMGHERGDITCHYLK